jgi:hypothetical protein
LAGTSLRNQVPRNWSDLLHLTLPSPYRRGFPALYS